MLALIDLEGIERVLNKDATQIILPLLITPQGSPSIRIIESSKLLKAERGVTFTAITKCVMPMLNLSLSTPPISLADDVCLTHPSPQPPAVKLGPSHALSRDLRFHPNKET